MAAIAFAVVAATDSPVLPVVTGSVLAGGVTSEMLLGHWFLVDPRLPRWSLKVLTAGAALGLVAEAGLVAVQLAVNGNAADPFLGWAWLALTVMTALLVAGVWFSLDEPRYTGVMAATGLSYLAVLTSFGVITLGRMIGIRMSARSAEESPSRCGADRRAPPGRSNLGAVKVYTRKGDDGTTGLLYGGRVAKDDTGPEAYGTTDEAVAALGVARAIAAESAPDLAAMLSICSVNCSWSAPSWPPPPRTTTSSNRGSPWCRRRWSPPLEDAIDAIEAERGMPTEFVVPGQNRVAAALDVARTVVRRAERRAVAHAAMHRIEGSQVVPYLNRLADYLWMAARSMEPEWESSTAEPTE